MTSAGFPCTTTPRFTTLQAPCLSAADDGVALPIPDAEGSSSQLVCPGVPGGPARRALELSEPIRSRIGADLQRLLDQRVILRPRATDLLRDSRVVTLRQLCTDWRRALQNQTQTDVRISIHGSVASRILSGEQPLLSEDSDLDIQFELDASQSSFSGLPPGNQLYQSTESLLGVISNYCPSSPTHRDLFSYFFANRVAIQPLGDERDGWSLYSMNMSEADHPAATSANYNLDLLVIWRGLQRPYLLSSDSFSVLLEGPLLQEFQVTSLFPNPQQALEDLQQSVLRVDQPHEVRRGLLGRLIKMMSRGHVLPRGQQGEELRGLLMRLTEEESSEALPYLLGMSRAGDSIAHLRTVWNLLQLFPNETDWQHLSIWPGADEGQWAPPRSVLRHLPEGSFKRLWSIAAKMERREWLSLATFWARSHIVCRAGAAGSSGGDIKGFQDLGGWVLTSGALEHLLHKRSVDLDGWLISLLEENRAVCSAPEERALLLEAWEEGLERAGSQQSLRCALLLLVLDSSPTAGNAREPASAGFLSEVLPDILAEVAYQLSDATLFQALVSRSHLRSCLRGMEWRSWGQYVPSMRLLKWVEALSAQFPGRALQLLERRRSGDWGARQLAGLRETLLKGSLQCEAQLRAWMRLFSAQAGDVELQVVLEASRNFDGPLEQEVLHALWAKLELHPTSCGNLAPSVCTALLQEGLDRGIAACPQLLNELLTRLQPFPQHLNAALPLLAGALALSLDQAVSLSRAHQQLIQRLLEDSAGRQPSASACGSPGFGAIRRAWELASGPERSQLLRVLRRFGVPLPAEVVRSHALWCGQEGLWQEAEEAWSAMLEGGSVAECLPWELCTDEGGLRYTERLWRRSVEQTGGCVAAWLVLPAWAEAMAAEGPHAVASGGALVEALPLAERYGATSALMRNCVRMALLSPGPKLDAVCGRLAEWFCRGVRFWEEQEAPESLKVLAEVRTALQQHRRERALEVCWQTFLQHPVQEGVDQLIWPFLAAAAMHSHVPRVLKNLAPQLVPQIVHAVEWLAHADLNTLSEELFTQTEAGRRWCSESSISDAALCVSILWRGLLMPGLLAILKHWPTDHAGFLSLQRVLSELSICSHTPEAAGAAAWLRLLAIGHHLLDRGGPVLEDLLSLWSVTQPTFADPEELIQAVFNHMPSLIKQGAKALERAVLLFCRMGLPPQPWHRLWITTFALLLRAARGEPTSMGILLGSLPAPLSPELCRSLSERERLEAARAVESLPLQMDWMELERFHVLHHLRQGLPVSIGCVKHRMQLTQVAVALALRAGTSDPRLAVSQVQAWIRICLDLTLFPEWTSQSVTVLSQVIQASISAGHSLRMLLESCSPLWEDPSRPTLDAQQWAQILLAFIPIAQVKHPDPSLLAFLRRGLDHLLSCRLREVRSGFFLDLLRALEVEVTAYLHRCPSKSKALPALQDVAVRMGAVLIALGYSRSLTGGLELWEAVLPACMKDRPDETRPAMMRAIEQLAFQLPEESKETDPFVLAALIQVLSTLCGSTEPRLAPLIQEIQNLLLDSSSFVCTPFVLLCHALPWAISQSLGRSDEGLLDLEHLALLLQPAWARVREALLSQTAPASMERLVSATLERVARFITLAEPQNRRRLIPLLAASLTCIGPDDSPDLKAQCWRGVLHAFSTLTAEEQLTIADALHSMSTAPTVLEELELAASSASDPSSSRSPQPDS